MVRSRIEGKRGASSEAPAEKRTGERTRAMHQTAQSSEAIDPLQLLTPKEVANLLRVKPNTLAHARSGRGSLQLRVVWIGPTAPRYRRCDVLEFIEQHSYAKTAQSHAGWRG
jgi:hypothetical protein